MDQKVQKNGIINLVVLLAAATAAFAVARYSHSLAGQVSIAFLFFGVLVAAVSWFQMRLEENERLEKLEFDELARSSSSSALFTASETEVFPAQRSRLQFEKFFVPGFTLVLFVLQAITAWWLWRWIPASSFVALDKATVAMALFGIFALVLFLLGKYSASIARYQNERLLRPGAGWLLLSAYLCFAVTAGIAAVELGFQRMDFYVARALCVLLVLIATETLVNLILEIYRPRVKGKVGRPVYESRLVGLLGQPEGLITTAAQALDYQFGFKVSETWFYRFLEKALLWLILLQLGVLILSTSVVFIEPGERGLLERVGKPVPNRTILEPGGHFKLPWPFDRVHRFRTEEIQSFNVGFVPDPARENEKTMLWTVSHYKEEFNLLVADREARKTKATNQVAGKKGPPPVNLLTVSIPVQFQINDLLAWAYNNEDPAQLLEKIATREVVRYLVSVDFQGIMSTNRLEASAELQKRIQAEADKRQLGAKVVYVGLQDIHPPVKVALDFEKVIGATQTNRAQVLKAKAYGIQTNALASARAFKTVSEAEARSHRTRAGALAQAGLFTNQIPAFKAAPTVYTERAYLQAFARSVTNARKYVMLATNTDNVVTFNLEDKIRPELLDVNIPSSDKK